MKTIFYPSGHGNTTAQAYYGIAVRRDQDPTQTDIVLINSHRFGIHSLWNSDHGRNVVLNKILATDLAGIATRCVRFFVLIDTDKHHPMHGLEFRIRLDVDDYKRKGNPYFAPTLRDRLQSLLSGGSFHVPCSWLTRDVVGGCARFFTEFHQNRHVPEEEMEELCAAVGYPRRRKGLPKWIKDLGSEPVQPV